MSTAVLTAVAWAYKNGARHIGHKSGSGVASGVFARCHRMAGNRVLMVSGTDEPQGLPEVDAPFASGESLVSFQRPSIAGGAQPLGQRTRPADAAPEPGAAAHPDRAKAGGDRASAPGLLGHGATRCDQVGRPVNLSVMSDHP